MNASDVVVLKFGSSVLRDQQDIPRAVHEIYRHLRAGCRVVAVVSAVGDTTDHLLRRATAIGLTPGSAQFAQVLASGEDAAVALMTAGLERAGVPARGLDAASVGLRCCGARDDAQPTGLDLEVVESMLAVVPVVVLPGFYGVAADGSLAVFGRGGSDLTALFIADQMAAGRCRLLKDVAGLYQRDPAGAVPPPPCFATATYDDALAVGGEVIQHKAVAFARSRGLPFELGALFADDGTRIGAAQSTLRPLSVAAPLRVGLLGLGTVGGGVFAALSALSETFAVVAVSARRRGRERNLSVAPDLWVAGIDEMLGRGCDAVVELIGGTGAARDAVVAALDAGCDVITANKALLAAHGPELHALAARRGAELACSAAVGGSLPALERIRQLAARAPIRAFEGVLNGTANFVLDRMAVGDSRRDAVLQAQRLGLAEADPQLDLDGTDAAHKLVLLARVAFPSAQNVHMVECRGVPESAGRGVQRLLATCWRRGDRVEARVRTVTMDDGHPMAAVRGAGNGLRVIHDDGDCVALHGTGAGRWPTTESVIGDLLALRSAGSDIRLEEAL